MINYRDMVNGATLAATAVSALYTTPNLTQSSIQAVSVTNPTGAPVTVNIYRVPAAGSPASANKIDSRVVAAGATVTMFNAINHKMGPAEAIYADGLACTLNVSGVEYIPAT